MRAASNEEASFNHVFTLIYQTPYLSPFAFLPNFYSYYPGSCCPGSYSLVLSSNIVLYYIIYYSII